MANFQSHLNPHFTSWFSWTRHSAPRSLRMTTLDSSGSSLPKSSRRMMSELIHGIRKLTPPKVSLMRTPSDSDPFVFEESRRTLFCPSLNCFQRLDKCSVMDHVESCHTLVRSGSRELNAIEVDCLSSESTWTAWAPTLLSAFDANFFLETCRSACGKWCMWVYHLGQSRENAFVAEIEAFRDDDMRLSYTGPVHSLETSQTKITSTGNCLVFCDAMARQLLSPLRKSNNNNDDRGNEESDKGLEKVEMGIAYRVRIRKAAVSTDDNNNNNENENDFSTHL